MHGLRKCGKRPICELIPILMQMEMSHMRARLFKLCDTQVQMSKIWRNGKAEVWVHKILPSKPAKFWLVLGVYIFHSFTSTSLLAPIQEFIKKFFPAIAMSRANFSSNALAIPANKWRVWFIIRSENNFLCDTRGRSREFQETPYRNPASQPHNILRKTLPRRATVARL